MSMNCEKAMQALLATLAGEPVTGRDAALAQHLTTCTECRDTSAEMTALWANLGALPETPAPAGMRARFETAMTQQLAAERLASATHRRRGTSGWIARLQEAAAAWRPASVATAAALAVAAFALGHFMASRGNEMTALRQELQSVRSMMALSLLQQRSPVDRLRGVGWTAQVGTPAPEIIDALFATLNEDSNVDVRLAAVDALSGLQDAPNVRERLLLSLERQQSPLVQIGIIDALVRLRDAQSQTLLQSIAEDSTANSTVRQRARSAVQQLTM